VIVDETETPWDVWEVIPTTTERGMAADKRRGEFVSDGQRPEPRVVVPARLGRGWLAFQSTHEKRRLSPIPVRWEQMSDGELLGLLAKAKSYGKPKRLIE
jgi:hypothetical protein